MKMLISFVLAVVLCGCASGGSQKMAVDKLSQIKPGVTTRAELLAWFGSPISQGLDTSGKAAMNWQHFEVHAAPFWSETKTQMLSVILDTNGVVEKFVLTDDLNKPKP